MYFAEFVQRLNKVLTVEGGRGRFAETVLRMVVTNEEKLNYSESSYNKFYDGKTEGKAPNRVIVGDNITTCAKNIQIYLDASKFTNYLKGFCLGNTPVNELCTLFKSEIPDIDCDNYAEKIAQLLIQILNEAAEKKSSSGEMSAIETSGDGNVRPEPEPAAVTYHIDNIDNHTEDNRTYTENHYAYNKTQILNALHVSKEETVVHATTNHTFIEGNRQNTEIIINMGASHDKAINCIKKLIIEINALIDDIDRKVLEISRLAHIISKEEQNMRKQEFYALRDKFDQKNSELRLYRSWIPELTETIEKIVLLSYDLNFTYHCRVDSNNRPYFEYDKGVSQYREYIDEIMRFLGTL